MAPLLWWVRGGEGGGAAPPPALGSVRGGGVGWGGPFGPLAMPLVGRGGGAGAAWRSWSRGPAIGQGVAPFSRFPYQSRMLAQALAGAPHPPAVVARRWPTGGGREG